MFGITDLSLFVVGTIAIVLLPGPNSMYVLTVSARHGLRMGYAGAAGVFLGDMVLMLLTALGAASVLLANPLLYTAVRWVGAAYLSYLGLRLIIGAWHTVRKPQENQPIPLQSFIVSLKQTEKVTAASVCRKAFMISLFNPKAILFFLSYFVQFVDPTYQHPALTFLLLGVVVQITSLLYLSALIFGGVRLAETFAGKRRLAAFLSTAIGLLFIGFGVRLAS